MTSVEIAVQLADRLSFDELFPDARCKPQGAAFDLETKRLVRCYLDALEREHPGIVGHLTRLAPRFDAAVSAALGDGRDRMTGTQLDALPAKLQHCPKSDTYAASELCLDLISPDGRMHVCTLVRTGVTPPRYPDHPVYRRKWLDVWGDLYWVFDSGELYESCAWHEAHRPATVGQSVLALDTGAAE